jgi:predicted phosphodiesterase
VAPVRAVFGNIDDHRIRAEFPEEWRWECEGMRFVMRHIGGRPDRYASGVRQWLQNERPDAFICGHSHLLRIQRDASWGGLYLNPGAAGLHGFHQVRTLLRFSVDEGQIHSMEAVELAPRR